MTFLALTHKIPMAIALCWFVCLSVVVVAHDVRWRRIPNRVVLPAAVGLTALLATSHVAAFLWGQETGFETKLRPHAFLHGTLAALGLLGVHLGLAFFGGVGGGDVKLTPVLGLLLGYFGGWAAVLLGTALAWGAAGAWVLARIILSRLQRMGPRRGLRESPTPPALPFAPFLIGGAWVALFVSI